jgi:hypothetical protein
LYAAGIGVGRKRLRLFSGIAERLGSEAADGDEARRIAANIVKLRLAPTRPEVLSRLSH